MIKITKGTPPKKNPKDDLDQRKKDIDAAFLLETSSGGEFTSVNIRAWKTAFYKEALNHPDKKYSIRSIGNNKYEIWRIK